MENITLSGLESTVLFLLGIAAVLVSIEKGVAAFNSLFKKKTADREAAQDARLTALEGQVKSLSSRLEKGDNQFVKLRSDIGELLAVQNVVLMHMISGNGIETLKQTKADLDNYMASR